MENNFNGNNKWQEKQHTEIMYNCNINIGIISILDL